MTKKTNKFSLKNDQSNILYKDAIKKSITFFSILFFISLIAVSYLNAVLYANKLVSKIERVKGSSRIGFRDFILTQKNQISCFKRRVSKAKQLKNFSELLCGCSSNIFNISVIDDNRNVVYSESNHSVISALNVYSDKTLGFSFDELKANPNKIFIGDVIEDNLLQRRYFFISSGIHNKNIGFNGAVLIRVDVNYLNYKLVPQENREIFINDSLEGNSESEEVYNQLTVSPTFTFLSKIIWSDTTLSTVYYNSSLDKYFKFEYNPRNFRKSFLRNFYISTFIICILLGVLFFLYWRMILLPMKESLMMIQRNKNGRKNIDRLFNIFYNINDFNMNQSALISKQEKEQREQFAKIISIIFSIGSLAHYITSKVEVLKEDIADMSTKNNEKISSVVDFNKRLKSIERTIAVSEKDIRSLTSEYTKFTQLIKNQNREKVCISASELHEAIRIKLESQNHSQTVAMTPNIKFDINVYKSFFITLLDEILNFNKKDLILAEIKICESKKLQFIFKKINSNFINFQNEQITLCKMLGMYNDIKVSISQDQEIVSIELNFSVYIKN